MGLSLYIPVHEEGEGGTQGLNASVLFPRSVDTRRKREGQGQGRGNQSLTLYQQYYPLLLLDHDGQMVHREKAHVVP